jgi:hypothetical protein
MTEAKREPEDKDWALLNSGVPLSVQNQFYLSYNHCSTCGMKIDHQWCKESGDGIYCRNCFHNHIESLGLRDNFERVDDELASFWQRYREETGRKKKGYRRYKCERFTQQ